MRYPITLMMTLLLAAGLTACGGGEETGTTPAGDGESMEAPGTEDAPAMPDAPEEAPEEAPSAGTETAPTLAQQAQELLDRAGQAAAGENWDQLKNLMGQLKNMKSKLSPELQKQIDDMTSQYAAQIGLSSSGFKLPGSG